MPSVLAHQTSTHEQSKRKVFEIMRAAHRATARREVAIRETCKFWDHLTQDKGRQCGYYRPEAMKATIEDWVWVPVMAGAIFTAKGVRVTGKEGVTLTEAWKMFERGDTEFRCACGNDFGKTRRGA